MKRLILTTLLMQTVLAIYALPSQSEKYAETRRLLLGMDRSVGNKPLKVLFEEADERMADLKKALYDAEKQVNLNAQVILKYFAAPDGLAALEEWYSFRRKQGQEYWMPKITLSAESIYLEGNDDDLIRSVLKILHPSTTAWAKMVAKNKRTDTVLIEIVYGEIFTEGWHVVVRKEEGKWRVISNNLVWQT
ncbi:MAG: hypothetical protein JNM09_24065 [Blastocatellia bacterium]|nr:hypothetical protein [Blastocatellia bacterium]